MLWFIKFSIKHWNTSEKILIYTMEYEIEYTAHGWLAISYHYAVQNISWGEKNEEEKYNEFNTM